MTTRSFRVAAALREPGADDRQRCARTAEDRGSFSRRTTRSVALGESSTGPAKGPVDRANGQLETRTSELDTELQELSKKLELYEEELAWYKNKRYGRSSEQLSVAERLQVRLFDEIETSADDELPEDKPAPEPAASAEPASGRAGNRCRESSGSSACPRNSSSASVATGW